MATHAGVSVGDILYKLDDDFQGRLVSLLQQDRTLKAAREACRALRRFVDSNVRQVRITLRLESEVMWENGSRLPIHLWERCATVRVRLSSSVDPQRAGSLLSLPFIELPPAKCRRITDLQVSWAGVLPGTALSSLLSRLPALRRLSLGGTVQGKPIDTRILCGAVASLPDLEHLGLQCGRALHGLGALAESSSLRSLQVYHSSGNQLDEAAASAIGRLQQLQQLLVELGEPAELLQLLRAVPQSVDFVQLDECPFLGDTSCTLHMSSGSITAVHIPSESEPEELLTLAAEALLPSGAVGERLERIRLESLWVGHSDDRFLSGPESRPLRDLLRPEVQVQVGSILIFPATGLEPAAQALSLFGVGTEELHLSLDEAADSELHMRIQLRPEMRLAAASIAGALQGGLAFAAGSPNLVDLAFELLITAGAAGGSVAARPAGAPGQGHFHALLLRCTLPPGAAPLPPGAEPLGAWLRSVAQAVQKAVVVASMVRPNSGATTKAKYLPVPCGPHPAAALLACRTPAELAVAAGVVEVIAGGVAASAGEASPAALEVTRVYLHHTWSTQYGTVLDCLAATLSQVARSVLDGDGPGQFAAGWSERQRLCWLLEQWSQLGALVEEAL